MRRDAGLIIAGGGPAGSAAAIGLARAGLAPRLLERSHGDGDSICGGFISWATLARLEGLGIDAARLGGHQVNRIALFAGRHAHVAPLPRPAMGLSRHRLDMTMREEAAVQGADVRRGVTIRKAENGRLIMADGEDIGWDSLFLATGKHDLRGLARPQATAGTDPELGLRLRLSPDAARARLIGDRIELHLFDRGYLGLVLQEDGSTNACMAVRKSRLGEAGGDPATLFAQLADASPALADRLSGIRPDARFDAIGNVPYGWRTRSTASGLFRLGDQAAVIPSLAGEGIGIALASADMAVQCWLTDGPGGAERYQRRFARAAAAPMAVAGMVKALGGSPAIFGALAALPGVAGLIARLTRIGQTSHAPRPLSGLPTDAIQAT
jgi:flavin-dependent dehydrogenase